MLNVPQLHEAVHLDRLKIGRMRTQKPEPERSVNRIDLGHHFDKAASTRTVLIDILPQKKEFGKPALHGFNSAPQHISPLNGDLATTRSWNDAIGAITFTSTNNLNVRRRKQGPRRTAIHFYRSQCANGSKNLMYALRAFYNPETMTSDAQRPLSVEGGHTPHEYNIPGINGLRSFTKKAESLLL